MRLYTLCSELTYFQYALGANWSHDFFCYILHNESLDKQTKSVPLAEDQRSALQAICRWRKVDAFMWKRAWAFLLLDAGYDAKIICEVLDIGPTVLTEWQVTFAGMGLSFLGLKDYSQRQGRLSSEKSGPRKHISQSILLETQMRFVPIFWLSMAKATAPLGLPS